MPRHQPSSPGVRRRPGKAYIHREVQRNLQDIAAAEDKTFSWVVAEIVYSFFGLTIEAGRPRLKRRRRKPS